MARERDATSYTRVLAASTAAVTSSLPLFWKTPTTSRVSAGLQVLEGLATLGLNPFAIDQVLVHRCFARAACQSFTCLRLSMSKPSIVSFRVVARQAAELGASQRWKMSVTDHK